MTKLADVLCQHIGGRNRAGFVAWFLLLIRRQIARACSSCSVTAANLLA